MDQSFPYHQAQSPTKSAQHDAFGKRDRWWLKYDTSELNVYFCVYAHLSRYISPVAACAPRFRLKFRRNSWEVMLYGHTVAFISP